MWYKVDNIIFNKPNLNGRVYTRNCFKEAINKLDKDQLFLERVTELKEHEVDFIDPANICGVINNIKLGHKYLYLDLELANNIEFKDIVPIGIGKVDFSNGNVYDYKLIKFIAEV